MSELFILQNQYGLFLGKQNSWVDGQDANLLYKTPYKDEAINQMVESSAKDYTQRIKVVRCAANDKGLPDIDPAILPEPLPGSVDMFVKDCQQQDVQMSEEANTDVEVSALMEIAEPQELQGQV